MVACVPAAEAENALGLLKQAGETAWQIGTIDKARDDGPQVVLG